MVESYMAVPAEHELNLIVRSATGDTSSDSPKAGETSTICLTPSVPAISGTGIFLSLKKKEDVRAVICSSGNCDRALRTSPVSPSAKYPPSLPDDSAEKGNTATDLSGSVNSSDSVTACLADSTRLASRSAERTNLS